MNPLLILSFVVLGLACITACATPFIWGMLTAADWSPGEADPFPFRKVGLAALAFVVALTFSIWVLVTLLPSGDNSEHCGPGTHYLETGSGKYRSWICVAS